MDHTPPKLESYITSVDYSGNTTTPPDDPNLIFPQMNSIMMTPIDVSFLPAITDTTYELTNTNGERRSEIFGRFSGPVIAQDNIKITYDFSNVLYGIYENVGIARFNTSFEPELIFYTSTLIENEGDLSESIEAAAVSPITTKSMYIPLRKGNPGDGTWRLVKLDLENRQIYDVTLTGATYAELNAIAFDPSGNLFLSDIQTDQIFKGTIVSENILDNNEEVGPGIVNLEVVANNFSGINEPRDLTCDRYGNVYIANSNQNNILKLDASGNVTIYSDASSVIRPVAIDYSSATDYLYVGNYGQPNIYYPGVVPGGGGTPTSYDAGVYLYLLRIANGVTDEYYKDRSGQGIEDPTIYYRSYYYYSVACDSSGNVSAVRTSTNDRSSSVEDLQIISLFDIHNSRGTPGKALGRTAGSSLRTRRYPIAPVTSMVIDSSGHYMYAVEYTAPFPTDSAQDPSYGYYTSGLLWKFDISGNQDPYYYSLTGPDAPTPELIYPSNWTYTDYPVYATSSDLPLNGPTSIAITKDASESLYIGNAIDSKLIVVTLADASGVEVSITGKQLDGPTGLSFDNSGNLYLVNYNDNTLCKLEFSDYKNATSSELTLEGELLDQPCSTSFNEDFTELFIANQGNSRVISYNLSTLVSLRYDNPQQDVSMVVPGGVEFDVNNGNLYVSDSATSNIYVMTNNGGYFPMTIQDGSSIEWDTAFFGGEVVTSVNNPQGLTLDMCGNIYVANTANTIDAILRVTYEPSNSILFNYKNIPIRPEQMCFDPSSGNIMLQVDNFPKIKLMIVNPSNELFFYGEDSFIGDPIQGPSTGPWFDALLDLDATKYSFSTINEIGPFIFMVVNQNTFWKGDGTPDKPAKPYTFWRILPDETTWNNGTYGLWNIIEIVPSMTDGSVLPTYTSYIGGFGGVFLKFNTGAQSTLSNDFEYATGPKAYLIDPISSTDTQIFEFRFRDSFSCDARKLNIGNSENILSEYNFQSVAFRNDIVRMYLVGTLKSNSYSAAVFYIDNFDVPDTELSPVLVYSLPFIGASEQIRRSINIDLLNYIYVGGKEYEWQRITQVADESPVIETMFQYFRRDEFNDIDQSFYDGSDNSIVCSPRLNKTLQKIPLSYNFKVANKGLESDENTLVTKKSSSLLANDFFFSYDVFSTYILANPYDPSGVDHSTITINFLTTPPITTPTATPILPNPTDSYYLLCENNIASSLFCNNCTFNAKKFVAGTYPVSLVISSYSNFTYVGLQNNTISRLNTLGVVEDSYIGTQYGLQDIASMALDASFNMYVLNKNTNSSGFSTNGYLTKITLEDEVISATNIVTSIDNPIDIVYDIIDNTYIYILSGNTPDVRITRYSLLETDIPGSALVLPIEFGSLYDPQGICVDENVPGQKIMYITNTNQNNVFEVKRLFLANYQSVPIYTLDIVATLEYKGFKIVNKNDGKLYIANKENHAISVFYIPDVVYVPEPTYVNPWATSQIVMPSDMDFDNSGNLYVAQSGTSPRNNRISKIYLDYFRFTDVSLGYFLCSPGESGLIGYEAVGKKLFLDSPSIDSSSIVFVTAFYPPIEGSDENFSDPGVTNWMQYVLTDYPRISTFDPSLGTIQYTAQNLFTATTPPAKILDVNYIDSSFNSYLEQVDENNQLVRTIVQNKRPAFTEYERLFSIFNVTQNERVEINYPGRSDPYVFTLPLPTPPLVNLDEPEAIVPIDRTPPHYLFNPFEPVSISEGINMNFYDILPELYNINYRIFSIELQADTEYAIRVNDSATPLKMSLFRSSSLLLPANNFYGAPAVSTRTASVDVTGPQRGYLVIESRKEPGIYYIPNINQTLYIKVEINEDYEPNELDGDNYQVPTSAEAFQIFVSQDSAELDLVRDYPATEDQSTPTELAVINDFYAYINPFGGNPIYDYNLFMIGLTQGETYLIRTQETAPALGLTPNLDGTNMYVYSDQNLENLVAQSFTYLGLEYAGLTFTPIETAFYYIKITTEKGEIGPQLGHYQINVFPQ